MNFPRKHFGLGALAATLLITSAAPLVAANLVDQKVEALLAQMTLDEKIGQMTQPDVHAITNHSDIQKYYLGSILNGGGGGPGFGAAAGADTTVLGGALAMKRAVNGEQVVVVGSDGKSVFLSGTRQPGAKWNTEAPRPWVDKLDFESGQRSRVFDSPADAYETFIAALDDDYSSYIYTHESPTVIRDAFLKDTKTSATKKLGIA